LIQVKKFNSWVYFFFFAQTAAIATNPIKKTIPFEHPAIAGTTKIPAIIVM